VSYISEAELPGLGKKYQLRLGDGGQIIVIIHDDGNREIYYFSNDADEPIFSVLLSDQESRQLGSIIGGAFYQPRTLEKLGTVVSGLSIEWLKVKEDSGIRGKSIGELGLRKNHGINIVAVLEDKGRGGKETVSINPGPGYVFQPRHIIVAAGRKDKMISFEAMFEGKS